MKDLVFQYQKGKMPWGWGCTYSNIFGFSILAHRSSFIQFFFCFSFIGSTLFKNSCSNKNQASNCLETSRIQAEHCKHFFFLTSYSFTKVWIPQSYFYLIIRFLSPYQNSYFTKLQVTLQFLWQAAYTQYKQYSQVTYARFE